MKCRYKIAVQGIVQGVGFRPYIYRLAIKNRLFGYVSNTSQYVDIEVEGESEQAHLFLMRIENCDLPLARITNIKKTSLSPANYHDFIIKKSAVLPDRLAMIPPDVCVCKDCLREMENPGDRRYRYPFINCTNCGPRYTIIKNVPYDRPSTSMNIFRMCEDCQKEYDDPSHRRFHAQPIACPLCGPRVNLYDRSRKPVETDDPVSTSAGLLKEGYILAIKGLGGFHLAVDAENTDAVAQLRRRKLREGKPLALMSLDLSKIRTYAHIDPDEESLLKSPERPIVILKKREPNILSKEISPGVNGFGVMLPYTPLHYDLLKSDIRALVMTSGNLSEEPIAIGNEEAFERLSGIADFFLIHNRDIYSRSDDSVFKMIAGRPRVFRRSRGYVPAPISLTRSFPQILACGGELKNTVCLSKGNHAFLSPHIGDLKNSESYHFFEQTIGHFKQLFDIDPEIIAYDLHPDYLCTRYAMDQTGTKKIGVQHHHAHIVSCMTEHGLEGPVIGLAFDGTGYGTDGRIWGGEILWTHSDRFTRLAHLDYVPMPGGSAAINEPWRMALSYLNDAFGEAIWELGLPLFETVEKRKIKTILEMIKKGINCPETSSLGRLFDGIAALLDICYVSSYEGQAAIELEMAIKGEERNDTYPYEWHKGEETYHILPSPIIRGVVKDILEGKSTSSISHKFHITLIRLFSDLCALLGESTGVDRIVLSGGVFQNALLLTHMEKALRARGFQVFSHSLIPTNDGGISLGQAAIAAAISRRMEE